MNNRLLLAFYGDDFTGSTDAMESLSIHGLRTVLFLKLPTDAMLDQFHGLHCIGIAGTARAKSKDEMAQELIPVYERLKEINPYFVHYKTCSTFDSSPEIGSIGYAADLALNYFHQQPYPILVAAPQLGRYTVFGQHFAKLDEKIYRLDRHPVMEKHPITPMKEADLAIHLSRQTNQSIELMNIVHLNNDMKFIFDRWNKYKEKGTNLILFDSLTEKDLQQFAKVIWGKRGNLPQFMIGSSGISYAFASMLQKDRKLQELKKNNIGKKIDRLLVVSGSASEVTSKQMKYAIRHGFHAEKIPYEYFGKGELPHDFLIKMENLINEKKKVIMYTTDGPDDEVIEQTRKHLLQLGVSRNEIGITIGRDLGIWVQKLVNNCKLRRLIVSGGDTSGFVTQQLNIYALELSSQVSPGVPLCRAYSHDEALSNFEIALKGGQVGGEDFYVRVASICNSDYNVSLSK